jgi:AraC-like DNA-binding protein
MDKKCRTVYEQKHANLISPRKNTSEIPEHAMSSFDCIPKLGQISHEMRKVTEPENVIRTLPNEHRISLLMQGEGTCQNGPLRIIADRPLAWFTPANDHESLHLRGQVDLWTFSFSWPGFEVAAVREREIQLRCFGKSRVTHRLKQIDTTDASRMVEYFKSFLRVSGRPEMTGELEIRSFIFLLLAFFTDLPEVPSSSGMHRSLEQFHVLLDERAFDPVSISELANQTNMSPEYLRHLFYRRFGVHPHAYRASLRMARARQLLTDPRVNVKEVAHLVGYDDPLYFSRVFKMRYGVTPSELRRRTRR